jgi:hypothetical protein
MFQLFKPQTQKTVNNSSLPSAALLMTFLGTAVSGVNAQADSSNGSGGGALILLLPVTLGIAVMCCFACAFKCRDSMNRETQKEAETVSPSVV